MKHPTFLALALSVLMLSSCSSPDRSQNAASAVESAAVMQVPSSPAVSAGKMLHNLNSGGTAPRFGISDTAAYLPMKFSNILLATKIDFATAQQQVLCKAEGCTHADDTCPAFMAADDDSLSQYYTGGLVAAGDRLYWFLGGGASPINVRVDVSTLDGSNRHTIIENSNTALLNFTAAMYFTDGDALYLATTDAGLVRLDDSGLDWIFPLNQQHPTSQNPLYTADGSTPRCIVLGCWQDMAVFSCTPALNGKGTGLIGVHTDGTITDLGTCNTGLITALHDGKLYYIPGSGNQAETIEVTDLASRTTETLPLPAGGSWNNYCTAYGDGTIGLIRNEVNYAWTPGKDTAVALAPTWYKDSTVPRSPVIYAENGTMALIKISDHAASIPQLTSDGVSYQGQQTIRELALIPLQNLFSGSQNWTPVSMLNGTLD